MSRTVLILGGALATLRRDGWLQWGPMDADGRTCLEFAIASQCLESVELLAAIQLAQRVAGTERLALWNDEPGRTFADVEALLTTAIVIATEQAQPKEQVGT